MLHSNLYTEEQLKTLDDLQWQEVEQNKITSTLLQFVNKIQNRHPELELKKLLDRLIPIHVLEYINITNWIDILKEKCIDLLLLSYTLNVAFHLWISIIIIKDTSKTLPKRIMAIIGELFLAFFPIVVRQRKKKCPCMEPGYLEEIYRYVEEREREKFLKNLNL